MTIEQAVRDRLLDISALTALVSSRIYQLRLPQGATLPAVRIQQISDVEMFHLRGPHPILRSRVQIDAYDHETSGSDPYASVANVADAIRGDGLGAVASGLDGWTGDAGGSPAQIHIAFARRLDRNQYYESEELRLVRCRQDFEIHWWEL